MGSKKNSEQFITINEAQPFDPTESIRRPTFNDTGVIYISVNGACTGLSANCDSVPKVQDKYLPTTMEVKERFKIKYYDVTVC